MTSPSAAGAKGYVCTPESCDPAGALQVIDDLLRATVGFGGEELDGLLELRWLLHHRQDAEAALGVYCKLRRSLENGHYLAFYRLRRWLENQVQAIVCLWRGGPEKAVSVQLAASQVQAIRKACLQAARKPQEPVFCPKVRFSFRCAAVPAEARPSGSISANPA